MLMTKVLFVIVALLAIIYMFGLSIPPDNCSSIGTCRQCWSREPVNISSELCPNPAVACIATASQQQHNAVVDVLLCACAAAQGNEYTDAGLNSQIEGVWTTITQDRTITAQQLCGSSGLLTKRQYG